MEVQMLKMLPSTLVDKEKQQSEKGKIIELKIEPKTKICCGCKNEFPIEIFRQRKVKGKLKRDSRCPDCMREKARIYRANMSEEQKARKRETSRRYRANLSEEKKIEIRQKGREYSANLPKWKKEEKKIRREIRRNRARQLWNQYKLNEGCFHCKGENLPAIERMFAEAYDSHHVHQGDKKTTKTGNTIDVSDMVGSGNSWNDIKEELKHCVTLCKICHSLWHQKLLDIDFTKWDNYDSSKPLKF